MMRFTSQVGSSAAMRLPPTLLVVVLMMITGASAQACSGICAPNEDLLNAGTLVTIGASSGTCELFDGIYKQVTDDPDLCNENSQNAKAAGCKCGQAISCPGICAEGELLNPGTLVTVGGSTGSCQIFDDIFRTVIDPELCDQNSQDAMAAGCNCGEPITCPGICMEQGAPDLLNPGTSVTVGGSTGTCQLFDDIYKQVTDPNACDQNSKDATAAGCKCGEAISCPGICTDEGAQLLNPGTVVKVGPSSGTCQQFDDIFKGEIDPDVCDQNSKDAIAAGCECTNALPSGASTVPSAWQLAFSVCSTLVIALFVGQFV